MLQFMLFLLMAVVFKVCPKGLSTKAVQTPALYIASAREK